MEEDFERLLLEPEREPASWRVPLLAAGIGGLGLLAGWLWLAPSTPQEARPALPAVLPALTATEEAYLPEIEIGHLELRRWANFLGQEVTYLDGTVKNRGPRTILALELRVEFKDLYNQTVLRQKARIVGNPQLSPTDPRAAPLRASEARDLRVAFEDLPKDWNQALPQITVTGLMLE